MKRTSYEIGLDAETLTVNYLVALGHRIIKQRWKSKFGEIDIISIKANELIFTEVKSRKNYSKEEVISHKQLKRNSLAALDFLGHFDVDEAVNNLQIRYDCIIVHRDNIVEHIENAWYIESCS